jgi:hypothetical protein
VIATQQDHLVRHRDEQLQRGAQHPVEGTARDRCNAEEHELDVGTARGSTDAHARPMVRLQRRRGTATMQIAEHDQLERRLGRCTWT